MVTLDEDKGTWKSCQKWMLVQSLFYMQRASFTIPVMSKRKIVVEEMSVSSEFHTIIGYAIEATVLRKVMHGEAAVAIAWHRFPSRGKQKGSCQLLQTLSACVSEDCLPWWITSHGMKCVYQEN